MPSVTLPDGSKRQFDQPVSILEVANDIGPGLAKAALGGSVNGELRDVSFVIEDDVELAIITDRDEDGLEIIRHSTAHLMAQAVKQLFPDAQVTIGPGIEDGFYYDFAYDKGFNPDDLEAIEKRMKELTKQDIPVERSVMARERPSTSSRTWGKITRPKSLPISRRVSSCHSTGRGILSIFAVGPTCHPRVS